MPKVIFDTVAFVRSLINPRSFWGKIIFEHSLKYRLFVSGQILLEILEVLKRPEITAKFRTIEGRDIKRILEILSQAEVVEISGIPQVSRDIKDDKFLATAKEAKVDYLVSAEQDLLDIKEYEGIKIIDAETFLNILSQL
mgnify:CR=1 FL=1